MTLPFLSRFLSVAHELLFPPHCPACSSQNPSPYPLCEPCSQSLYPMEQSCPRCAFPIEGEVSVLCVSCRRSPPPYRALFASYRYGGELAVALRRLKFGNRADIARTLAPLLTPTLHKAATSAHVAVPIPLHWKRLSKRGFNQSALLLRYAGKDLSIPTDTKSLVRIRHTTPQAQLPLRERRTNVSKAFAVRAGRRKHWKGKTVLLVDDVVTTGATMSAAARAAYAAGAKEVLGCCLARAEL